MLGGSGGPGLKRDVVGFMDDLLGGAEGVELFDGGTCRNPNRRRSTYSGI